jgi:small-conductance mechanosensitive channel
LSIPDATLESNPRARFQWLKQSLAVAATLVALLVAPAPAYSASGEGEGAAPIELPDNLTRQEVRDLIARMSDHQVRELIITQLDKVAEDSALGGMDAAATYVDQMTSGVQVAGQMLLRAFESDDRFHALPGLIWQRLTDNGKVSGWFLLFQLAGLLIVGWLAERVMKQLTGKIDTRLAGVQSISQRVGRVVFRAVCGLFEIAAFVVAAKLFLAISASQISTDQSFWQQILLFIVYVKVVLLLVSLIVSPGRPGFRLVPVEDTVAQGIWRWALIIAIALTFPFARIAADFGADAGTVLLIRIIFTTLFIVLLVVLVCRLRGYGAALIAGDQVEPGSIREAISRSWWIIAILYILLVWLLAIGKRAATGESSMVPGLGSLIMFASIPYVDIGLRWLVARYFEKPGSKEQDGAASAIEEPVSDIPKESDSDDRPEAEPIDIEPGYIATALRYARVLFALTLLTIFVNLWNIDLVAITGRLVGDRFAAALFDISLTVLLTWAVWGVIRITFERRLADEKSSGDETDDSAGEGGGPGGTRMGTVLPLIRVFIQITLIVMAVMLSLSAMGVDIGPLIAGAGVIGIAVGFGAQSLVRDIVSGLFFLLDDAFRVGEYVEIGKIRGTVERISVRSFQLRHHKGAIHTIPYGEIQHLTNYSRDWAIMKFELRVPFETDINMLRKIIKKVGQEMMEDPELGPDLLEPLKSQGINRMDDSALIIRCKFTAIPGKQFVARREAFTRIQKAFDEKGIKFAPRRVLVESVSPVTAQAGAAAGSMDQELPAGGAAPSDRG